MTKLYSASYAQEQDAQDPLRHYRELFHIPTRPDGQPCIYFCSHSLGLEPKNLAGLMQQELDNWAQLGVEGHFHGQTPWYTYHKLYRHAMAKIVGALPEEVVLMNGLTVNQHLLMMTFYRPTKTRFKILIESPTFPSDLYAIKSQLAFHGIAPADGLMTVEPRGNESLVRMEDIAECLRKHGPEIALVWISGVNFLTGQAFDLETITKLAHEQGCTVGFDLAHAAGNIPLHLHFWNVDCAVWCTYKYLNCGPGAIAGAFVHERHANNLTLPRLAGWWGNDPDTRFRMHLEPDFVPQAGAGGWQISNPPVLALVPLRASMALYEKAGMPALRAKSVALTDYLLKLLHGIPSSRVEVITPRVPAEHGCQVSFRVRERPREMLQALKDEGVILDFREPDFLRVAPVPFYNTFEEVWRFALILRGQ